MEAEFRKHSGKSEPVFFLMTFVNLLLYCSLLYIGLRGHPVCVDSCYADSHKTFSYCLNSCCVESCYTISFYADSFYMLTLATQISVNLIFLVLIPIMPIVLRPIQIILNTPLEKEEKHDNNLQEQQFTVAR